MDLGTLLASLGGVGVLLGGATSFIYARTQGIAGLTQQLQQRIELLNDQNKAKDQLIVELKEQVRVLTELVTSKADVESVKLQLDQVQRTLDLIAEKVGIAHA